MTTIRQALARATYEAAHHVIRVTGDTNAAWTAAHLDGMPCRARDAAVEAFLSKATARPAMPLADRLANHKLYKQIGL